MWGDLDENWALYGGIYYIGCGEKNQVKSVIEIKVMLEKVIYGYPSISFSNST